MNDCIPGAVVCPAPVSWALLCACLTLLTILTGPFPLPPPRRHQHFILKGVRGTTKLKDLYSDQPSALPNTSVLLLTSSSTHFITNLLHPSTLSFLFLMHYKVK